MDEVKESRSDWVVSLRKRLFDLVCTILGLTVLWPLFLVAAVLIWLNDGGPVFFRQQRVARDGATFRIWKFRSMVPAAVDQGIALTASGDRRVTRVGAWLRRFKIDELPQLFNVLRGEMSLVGPRPEVPQYVDLDDPAWGAVLTMRPGITGFASLAHRHEEEKLAEGRDPEQQYRTVILPEKLTLNTLYAQTGSFWVDLKVIVFTVGSSLWPRYYDTHRLTWSLLGQEKP